MSIQDVIIIGGGPAGYTAALFASRRGLTTTLIATHHGGQAVMTAKIENYPGIHSIGGLELMNDMKSHAELYGARVLSDSVISIKRNKHHFRVTTTKTRLATKTIIIASGRVPRRLNIPGETQFQHAGVYWSLQDVPKLRGSVFAVIGGGESAFQTAESLANMKKKVYLLHRSDQFSASLPLIKKVKNNSRVRILTNANAVSILGNRRVTGLRFVKDGTDEMIKVDALFVNIGLKIDTTCFGDIVALNSQGEIIANRDCQTSCDGIFACGDITDIPYKQIVISAGEGAKAAIQAYKYLSEKRNKKVSLIDWS